VALTELDRHLLNRCLEHDPGAWNDFVDRYLGLMFHVVYNTAHSRSVRLRPEDAEDVCAEILLQIVAHDYAVLRRFRGKSSLATYITVVARRISVRELVRRNMAAELGHTVAHVASGAGVEVPVLPEERIDNEDEVRFMLEGLAEKEAAVVRMYHMEGKSYHEIGQATGIPENSIGPTLNRAREKLRRRAEQRTPA
jgi:RNA polymerase sigma-70 factor (ECF subfamily)